MRRRAVRAADLLPPRAISSEDFDLICRTSKIPTERREEVREFLADAVAEFGEVMARARTLPSRQSDRRAIGGAINNLRRAENRLKQKMGPAGLRALRLSGREIGFAVSDAWLRTRFPNEFDAPTDVNQHPNHNPLRLRPRDTDWLSERETRLLDYRVDFVRRHGGTVITKLLHYHIAALEKGLRFIVDLPDGPEPLRQRAYMLAALAELWRRIGLRPTSGANSRFGSFCESVFDAIGWPTEGVNSALPDAINLWRTLYR
jgi:hypothetical protein